MFVSISNVAVKFVQRWEWLSPIMRVGASKFFMLWMNGPIHGVDATAGQKNGRFPAMESLKNVRGRKGYGNEWFNVWFWWKVLKGWWKYVGFRYCNVPRTSYSGFGWSLLWSSRFTLVDGKECELIKKLAKWTCTRFAWKRDFRKRFGKFDLYGGKFSSKHLKLCRVSLGASFITSLYFKWRMQDESLFLVTTAILWW